VLCPLPASQHQDPVPRHDADISSSGSKLFALFQIFRAKSEKGNLEWLLGQYPRQEFSQALAGHGAQVD
jgi:hypothetical protein